MIADAAGQEAATIAEWFAAARKRQAEYAGPMPPRLIVENARTMADYLGLLPAAADAAAPAMAFWQMFLPSAMVRDPANFTDVAARLPQSFAIVRDAVAAQAAHRQLVYAAFHMTMFPLLAAMLARAVEETHGERGHVLIARRNLAWLRTDAGQWVAERAHVIATDASGLRGLHAGLRDGAIRRLLILVDGPHPFRPGVTHPLTTVAPTLGFKTALLHRVLEMRIPVLPLTNYWDGERFVVDPQPLLPAASDASIATMAELIESLLRRHPEQWLNWSAARVALARASAR